MNPQLRPLPGPRLLASLAPMSAALRQAVDDVQAFESDVVGLARSEAVSIEVLREMVEREGLAWDPRGVQAFKSRRHLLARFQGGSALGVEPTMCFFRARRPGRRQRAVLCACVGHCMTPQRHGEDLFCAFCGRMELRMLERPTTLKAELEAARYRALRPWRRARAILCAVTDHIKAPGAAEPFCLRCGWRGEWVERRTAGRILRTLFGSLDDVAAWCRLGLSSSSRWGKNE